MNKTDGISALYIDFSIPVRETYSISYPVVNSTVGKRKGRGG